jgi:ABC-type glutathione transport system ATPase component
MAETTPPLVTIRGLQKTFRGGRTETVAARNVDLTIHRGEIVGLVGESGSGKSTIANILLGLVEPDSGHVAIDGRALDDWLRRDQRGYRATVQAVFQQPLLALDQRRTVGWSIGEPLLVHRRLSASARRDRVAELLTMVGLEPAFADRRPGQLSGGQLQRVNIARALALGPRLMVCDEAVSALDVSVQAQIIDLFLDIQQRLDVAILFISHNMAVVRHIADSLAVMYHGAVVESGPTDEVCGNPRSDYTRALLAAWLDPLDRRERRAVGSSPTNATPEGPEGDQ